MTALKPFLRLALGCLVIAHGLAHAAMPLRGWIDPARLDKDFSPILVYAVAVIGFTIAGLGLIGIRRLEGAIRPLLVLASAYSLIGMWVMGSGGLWWGRTLDIVLFFTGILGLYRRLPAFEIEGRPWRAAFRTAVAAAAVYGAIAVVSWPVHRAWGSDPNEHVIALPGDDAERNRFLEIQHAVTIDARPEQVWPWLMQLGQDRGGFYSYDWLERAFGVEIRNATAIKPEWQSRQAGDRVNATQPNYLGGVFGERPGWTVMHLEANRAMVLRYWGAFVLEPTADGKTRFIIRTKVGDTHMPAWMAALDMMAFEMPHFIMERKMMLRIKSLAEAS